MILKNGREIKADRVWQEDWVGITCRIDAKKAPYILQHVQENKSAQHTALEEYKRKLVEAEGEVNKIIANPDGVFRKAEIEADVYDYKQKLLPRPSGPKGSPKPRASKR